MSIEREIAGLTDPAEIMIMFAKDATVSNINYHFSPLPKVAHGKLQGSIGPLVTG
jgi:hypothetical protein